MKKLVAAGVLAVMLVLTGCAGSISEYRDDLRSANPELAGKSDAEIDRTARSVCHQMDRGMTMRDYLVLMLASGVTEKQATSLATYATKAFCPEYAEE